MTSYALARQENLWIPVQASPGVRRCTRVARLFITPEDAQHYMSMTVHYRVSLSADSTTTGEGRLLDLSLEGCRIESDRQLPVNTYLSLRLQISPEQVPILVDLAAVRWTRGTNCGVHFLSIQPLQSARLQTFLASASARQQPPTPGAG
ncbi:MAG: PilZ domain-containing protein [Nitrospira sp. NTP1]|nr:PilZ domain-containing protein [Nitrospira sp. NTP1]